MQHSKHSLERGAKIDWKHMLQHKNHLDIVLSNIYTSNLIHGRHLKRQELVQKAVIFNYYFLKNL